MWPRPPDDSLAERRIFALMGRPGDGDRCLIQTSHPGIWGDTPPFVEPALRTLEARKPTVVGGRDPGYPAFLATTFTPGGDLGTAVLLQEAAWVALMMALAATAQSVTRSAYSLGPIILVVMYPGLLMFRNIITAEILYSVFLNLTVLGLLFATGVKNPVRCWMVAGAVLIAAVAACFKAQGILVSIAVIPLGVWIARPDTPGRLALVVLSCASALALVATGFGSGLPLPTRRRSCLSRRPSFAIT
jgi:hypothetical protein